MYIFFTYSEQMYYEMYYISRKFLLHIILSTNHFMYKASRDSSLCKFQ